LVALSAAVLTQSQKEKEMKRQRTKSK